MKTKSTNHPQNFHNLSRREYDAIKALNYTGSKEILKSPLHYKTWLNTPREETKALRIGKMVHEAILTPDLFERYKPLPDVDKRTKDGRETIQYFQSTLTKNDISVDNEEYNFVLNVSDSVQDALDKKGIKFEYTETVATAEYNNTPLKCSFDGYSQGVLFDIKTTDDTSPEAFLRTVRQYKYNLQQMMYCTITGAEKFVFIAVEKQAPYSVCFYELGNEIMAQAFLDFETAVKRYKHSTEHNIWDGYSQDIVTLDIPKKNSLVIPFA